MNILPTAIPDVMIIEPRVFGDHRGYFFEQFRQDIFNARIGNVLFIQDNQSKSSYGVLRGLHFQRPPHTQSKLVWCMQGEVLDVAVDIRIGSPTYGRHVAVRLDDQSHRQLWIPRGFAHGFLVLTESAVFGYKCDAYYEPASEGGILWNDAAIGIDWGIPAADIKLSDKDRKQPLLQDVDCFRYEDFKKEAVYATKP